MARPRRTTWLKVTACVFAIASLTINFGLIDLIDGFTGYVDQARNQVLDVGWGAVFGLILPLGLLSQLRRPERRLAGCAGPRPRYFARAAGMAVVSAVLLALHPMRHTFLARGQRVEAMLVLA